MKLIDDDHKGLVSYWISREAETKYEIGLKAVIDFGTEGIKLIEEDMEGNVFGSILMNFKELRNLQTIIEERKQDEKKSKEV